MHLHVVELAHVLSFQAKVSEAQCDDVTLVNRYVPYTQLKRTHRSCYCLAGWLAVCVSKVRLYLLVKIRPGVVWTRHGTIGTKHLATTFCGTVLFMCLRSCPNFRLWSLALFLTTVFVSTVGFISLVVAVWMTVTHRHGQQTATVVTRELVSGATL